MKKILVVGKDPKVSEDLRKHFDPQEYQVFPSYDRKNTIASVRNLKPNLIILELNLFPHWGTEIIEELKESNSNLPIIAITDSSSNLTKMDIIKEKVYAFVKTPAQTEKLSCMVKEALSSDLNRAVHTPVNVGGDQRELKKVTKVLGLSESSEMVKADCEKTRSEFESIGKEYTAGEKDYAQMFDHLLTPMYEEVLVNSKGKIYDQLISSLEKSLISLTLKYCRHNQVKASQILGISRNTLRERIKKYDLW